MLRHLLVELPEGEAEMPADLRAAQGLLHRLREEDDLHGNRGGKDQFDRDTGGPRQGIGDRRHDADRHDEP
jgi:hypothetical protein